jgi:hypothetical protein
LRCTTAKTHFECGSAHAIKLGFQLPELSSNEDAEAISVNMCVMVEADADSKNSIEELLRRKRRSSLGDNVKRFEKLPKA